MAGIQAVLDSQAELMAERLERGVQQWFGLLRVIATLRQLVADRSFLIAAASYLGAKDLSTLQPAVRRNRTDGTWASAGTVVGLLRAADNAIRAVFDLPPRP